MQLRYNYRLDPTPGQRQALAKAFGCARVVYNDALRTRLWAFEAGRPNPSDGELSRLLTEAKGTPERSWLNEVSAVVLQQALADLNNAYRNFFASLTGKRKGKQVKKPRFRTRKDPRQSIRFSRNAKFKVTRNSRLRLAKIGDVPINMSRPLPSIPSSVSITLDGAGRYHASFVVEVPDDVSLPDTGRAVGIDLGLATFATLSTGEKIDNPRFALKAQRKLRKARKDASRKQEGSKRREVARRRIARCHAKVRDTRRDWLHKKSTYIVRENQAIYVEDLNVAGLARTRMQRSINDAGWSTFLGMLEYKAARGGREFFRIDRFFPSSRLCSACGVVGAEKPPHVRTWTCECGTRHDRDLNAAINILAAGRADSTTPVELALDLDLSGQPAVKQEPTGSTV